MNTANQIVIELAQRNVVFHLKHALTIHEVYQFISTVHGKRPTVVTMSGGIARIVL